MVYTHNLNCFRGPKDIYFCVSMSREILIAVALNFDIHQIPPSIVIGVIVVQEKKRDMERWTRYNIVVVFYNSKLDKINRN